jgi:predicted nucleic acid-binding protein
VNTLYVSSKLVAVSNTGPLLSAFQCGRVDLLKHYLAVIHIPQSELTEFERHNAGEEIRSLIREGFVVVHHLDPEECIKAEELAKAIAASVQAKVKEFKHHLPEAEAMVLMKRPELGCEVLLLEEKAAREVARELKLEITGFVGIVAKAATEGIITIEEVRRLLEMCRQKGTRYSDALIEWAQEYGRERR